MNLVFPSFCILVAGAAGYFLEPQLESTLLQQKKPAVVKNEAASAEADSVPPAAPLPAPPAPDPAPPSEIAEVPKTTPPPEPTPDPAPPVETPPAETVKADPAPAPPSNDDLLPPPPPLGDLGGGNGDAAKNNAIVDLMKESIRDGQVTEFTVDQVMAWKAGGMETFDGDTYQVGLAAYKADTIFGVKTLEAKALIKGGKVVKWIWSKSKLEIK